MPRKSRRALAEEMAGVSLETLELVPERAVRFALGVASHAGIRAALSTRGYSEAEHEELWDLLKATCALTPLPSLPEVDPGHIAAINELTRQDRFLREVVSASLARKYPGLAANILDGLLPPTAASAPLNVQVTLERIRALQARRGKDHKAAFAILVARGITAAFLAELDANVALATSILPIPTLEEGTMDAFDHAYVGALAKLYFWFDEWSRIARISIHRRDHLIVLGLARRKDARKPDPVVP